MKILILSLLALNLTFAHDGHNHGAGQIQPTKGGVIMKNDHFFLEVVGSNKEVKFYPLKQTDPKSQMLKPIPVNEMKLTAWYSLPRVKKKEPIVLKTASDHFVGMIDAKKSHRYEVEVHIDYMNKKEEMTYQIEPQE